MLEIGRILHAGYSFKTKETHILFDPIFENPFSRNCYAFPEVAFDVERVRGLSPDAVFISHHHDDHFSLESLQYLDKGTPIYFYCLLDEAFEWIRGLGFKNLQALKLNQTIELKDIRVTPLRALDKFVDCLFKIETWDFKILNVVDSWIDEDILQELAYEAPWDVVLWPFQTMRELEVIAPRRMPPSDGQVLPEHKEQLKKLNPRFLIPSSCQFIHESWSWYRQAYFPISYQNFQSQVNQILPKTSVQRIEPSEVFLLDSEGLRIYSKLPYVRLLENTKVDYNYSPYAPIPSTREIASHFPALSLEQTEQVLEFAQTTLPQIYRQIGAPDSDYFQAMRVWKLIIYDNAGEAFSFCYELQGQDCLPLHSERPHEWQTEIPISRLWSAIYEGESLTSLYLRVNDCQYSMELEQELVDLDVGADPLIRVLFSREECSYQRFQLLRLARAQKVGEGAV